MGVKQALFLTNQAWTHREEVSTIGFALNGTQLLRNEKLAGYFANCDNFNDFEHRFASLDGQFSVIVYGNDKLFAACSHNWTYPLFYRTDCTPVVISDTPAQLEGFGPLSMQSLSNHHFLLFGVTPLHHTLHPEIAQIRPGEALSFRPTTARSTRALAQLFEGGTSEPIAETPEELHQILLNNFEKYYELLRGKQILLPLTRGYDSRILACLLKESGHPNVLCTSWGRVGNEEQKVAAEVAQKLGYKYHFEATRHEDLSNLRENKRWLAYTEIAAHRSSMPFFYDYFGLQKLSEKGLIGTDTVALPGHPGDYLKGSHLHREMNNFSTNDFIEHIIRFFTTSVPASSQERKELFDFIRMHYFKTTSTLEAFMKWDYEERQCKFIGNSTHSFSFHGIEVVQPLFNKNILCYFHRLSPESRFEEKLYREFAEKLLFKKMHVDFNLPPLSKPQRLPAWKEQALRWLPHRIKQWYYPTEDPIFYKEITDELRRSFKDYKFVHPLKPHYYNGYISQWYLQHVAQQLKHSMQYKKKND